MASINFDIYRIGKGRQALVDLNTNERGLNKNIATACLQMYQSSPLSSSLSFIIFSDVTLNVGHQKGYFADIPSSLFLCVRSTEAQQSKYKLKYFSR